jgi:carbon storage regulator
MPLVLGRRLGERVIIDERIVIEIADIRRGQVQLSINAPDDVPIRRGEIRKEDFYRQRAEA